MARAENSRRSQNFADASNLPCGKAEGWTDAQKRVAIVFAVDDVDVAYAARHPGNIRRSSRFGPNSALGNESSAQQ
jgi:uncharacterized protein (DUF924 family)